MQKDQWGCTKPVRQPYPFPGDKAPVSLCPLTPFRDDPTLEYTTFSLHRHWTHGILPEPGGLSDQAANYPEFIVAVDMGIHTGQDVKREIDRRIAERRGGTADTSGTARPPSSRPARTVRGRG